MTSVPTLTSLFSLLTRRPPTSTLFPYTTLFRSDSCTWRGSASRSSVWTSLPTAASRSETRPSPVTVEDRGGRSEEHTSELQSQSNLVCRLLLEKKKTKSRLPSQQSLGREARA